MKLFPKSIRDLFKSPSSFQQWGQAVSEFALMLPVFLVILFVLIEGALVIQGYLTVQHAAREAARWAVTYQPVQGETIDGQLCGLSHVGGTSPDDFIGIDAGNICYEFESDAEYSARRVALIKETAVQRAAGLRIGVLGLTNTDFNEYWDDTSAFYGVRVTGDTWAQPGLSDHPGLPGLPVQVEVVHRVELVDPFLRAVAPNGVRVRAGATMVNEGVQVWQPSPTPFTPTPGGGTPIPSPTPPDLDTPTPTRTPTLTPTPPPGGYVVNIPFSYVTNTLPFERGHDVEALVTDIGGTPMDGVRVSFSTTEGAYDYNGVGDQYAEDSTNGDGIAMRAVFANEPVTATLRAWVDMDGDDTWDSGEPSDTATKAWFVPGEDVPYILPSHYQVLPLDWITVDIHNHDQIDDPHTLLWCRTSITGGVESSVLYDNTINVGADGDEFDLPVEIPIDSAGYYQLETHKSSPAVCGDGSLVAFSADIQVVADRPDLAIDSITAPAEVEPTTLFTMSVVIENKTAGSSPELFDIDFYLDPGGEPLQGSIGEVKQWVSGISPLGTVTVNAVMWVGEAGTHEIWVQVDTGDYVDETIESNNTGMVTISAVCALEETNEQVVIPASTFSNNSSGSCGGAAHTWEPSDYNGTTTMLASPDSGQGCFNYGDTGSAPLLEYDVQFDNPGRYYVWVQGRPCAESSRGCVQGSSSNDSFWVTLDGAPDTNNNYRITGWGAGGLTWSSAIQGTSGQPYLDVGSAGSHSVQVRMREDGFEWSTIVLTTTSGTSGQPVGDGPVVGCGAGDPPPWSADSPGLEECASMLELGTFEGNPATVFQHWTAGDSGAFQRTGFLQHGGAFSMRLHDSLGSYPDCTVLNPWVQQTIQIPSSIIDLASQSGVETTIRVEGYRAVGGSLADCSFYNSWDYDDDLYVQIQDGASNPDQLLWPPAGGTPTPAPTLPPADTPTPAPTLPPTDTPTPPPSAGVILDVDFNTDEDGFIYADDTFRSSNQPAYASGTWLGSGGFSGGGLQVTLGGINGDDINNMSGGWQRDFTLSAVNDVVLFFYGNLVQSPEYETDEYSQLLVSIDGVLRGLGGNDYVAQVVGDGGGGGDVTTGWQYYEVNLGTLSAGSHTLTIGGYNNKKTYANEVTEVFIDDVLLDGSTPLPTPTPIPTSTPQPTGEPPPENWVYFNADFTDDVDLVSLAGDDIQVRFYATHDGDDYGTWFYLDDVECDVCALWPIPDDESGTASIGGLIRATVGGVPQIVTGVDVLAYSPGGQIYRTRSIHNGTYHFYNIPPGAYYIYAEDWIDGSLAVASADTTVVSDERDYGINLVLE